MVFSPVRLKVQLKLTINRLKMLQAKKASLNQAQRMEIAGLLKNGKVESAKIKVERIIREDYLMEAMEILELYCELLLARFGLLEQMKNCDPSIAEAVNSIIYATPRTDQVRELSSIRDQLAAKFGKEFTVAALENQNDVVNPRIVSKLAINNPDPFLVTRYLEEIARYHNVNWTSSESDEDVDDDGDDGGIAELKKEVEQSTAADPSMIDTTVTQKEIDLLGDIPSSPTSQPVLNPISLDFDLPEIPTGPLSEKKGKGKKVEEEKIDCTDFDELTKRFEALKKR